MSLSLVMFLRCKFIVIFGVVRKIQMPTLGGRVTIPQVLAQVGGMKPLIGSLASLNQQRQRFAGGQPSSRC